MRKKCCKWFLVSALVLTLLLTIALIFAVIGLGAKGIISASIANDERYMRAYCNNEDNFETQWKYWMAGSSACILPFSFFGSLSIFLAAVLVRNDWCICYRNADNEPEGIEMRNQAEYRVTEGTIKLKQSPLQKTNWCVVFAPTGTFFILMLLSGALSCFLWGIAYAYDNARTPNKTVDKYLLVDSLVGIVMPFFCIAAAFIASPLLYYVSKGNIDTREIIAKVLGIKLKKGQKAAWVIHDTFYFRLKKVKIFCGKLSITRDSNKFLKFLLHSWATLIMGMIVSITFFLCVSYFMDRTVIMSFAFQDWPDRSMGDVDCFLSTSTPLYVSPMEQEPTDRLHNCTVFFEQCQSNCSATEVDDFENCANECANCLSLCTTVLRSDLERVRVCNPPLVDTEAPSCPVSSAACIDPATVVLPGATSSCPTAASSPLGSGAAEIAPIVVQNNTERLEKCIDLLQTCSVQVSMCSTPNCTELQRCNNLLAECRKPPIIVCFQFLQFGRSTNVLQALAESYALFLSAVGLFNAMFVVVRYVLLSFIVTRWWGIGFIGIGSILMVGMIAILLGDTFTAISFYENVLKLSQFVLAPAYVIYIGLLFPVAKFKKPADS